MRDSLTAPPHTLQCLEVWGGNQAVENGVVMAGVDAWLFSRPYHNESAGGDIHYVSSCASGRITRALVADVSGHGASVAEIAGKLRGLMRRYVNYVDPARFLQELNVEFGSIAEAGGFATAVVATYQSTTDRLIVSNAGHPRPLWYLARSRTWSLLADDSKSSTPGDLANVPLGVAEPTRYSQIATRFAAGDMVILYTDSLTEARGADGRMLGEQGLLDIVRGLDSGNPPELLQTLIESVFGNGGDVTDGDDVTILVLRPNNLKPRVSAGMMTKAAGRTVKAACASFRPEGPPFPWPQSRALEFVAGLLHRINPRWGMPPQNTLTKPRSL